MKIVNFLTFATMTLTTTLQATNIMSWNKFKEFYLPLNNLSLSIDVSRMNFEDGYFKTMEPKINQAFQSMVALEKGAIANPDEKRQVGHYWLRAPELAPDKSITQKIQDNLKNIKTLAQKIHTGEIKGAKGNFKNMLIIGIGGSALGPQFVANALGHPKKDKLIPFFFDNTDPEGIDTVLSMLEGKLGQTLVIVISKSGSTPETRNGMIEAEYAYKNVGLDFGKHAIAITGEGSKLAKYAKENHWIGELPLWDWVGGRTSELSAVGLLPAALQGLDIEAMLKGAKEMDVTTRIQESKKNPAALLALSWYHATGGKGQKDMVILPYKERLSLFSKYLQQLVMESLGKEKDLQGNAVFQGIAVYGNKGSTDQHAYVQQLREGVNNFFVTFIEVLKDRNKPSLEIDPGVTSGDYLSAFLLGTRDALTENNRESITITINEVSPYTVGSLIALYERAVGLYANLVGINAYDQPGVEAGKKAAASTLKLQEEIIAFLKKNPKMAYTAEELAKSINAIGNEELVFKLLEHFSNNKDKCIRKVSQEPFYMSTYAYIKLI